MLARVFSGATVGLESVAIEVEVDIPLYPHTLTYSMSLVKKLLHKLII